MIIETIKLYTKEQKEQETQIKKIMINPAMRAPCFHWRTPDISEAYIWPEKNVSTDMNSTLDAFTLPKNILE